ncbi:tetratricopeptide repeat protein [Maribacter sp. 2304DJ31-5]|uniref:tetratricopeptide repeat protein n=1 Tax=Maribacter sp. 2304DJ31-5 TaxID=3386273 RepID=UPI0039BCF002
MRIVFIVLLLFNLKAEAQNSTLIIADSLYATGNYIKAINTYAKVGSTQSGLQIARAYNTMGNFEKSVLQYEGVMGKNPQMEIARFELGKLLLKINKHNKAQGLFMALIAKNPNNPEYHYQLGRTLQKMDSLDQSIPHYSKAVVIDSTHLRSHFQLAKYYLIKREKDSVMHYADMGLVFYPEDVSLINFKALGYFNNKEYTKSIPFFEKLLKLGEQKKYVYLKLGYAYFRGWEFEKSKEAYKTAIGMDEDENNGDVYYELGQVFKKGRELDSAAYYIKKSIAIQKPYLAEEYESLAQIFGAKEHFKESLEYYRLAHKENPEESRLYYQICSTTDRIVKSLDRKLECYKSFIKRYGRERPYISRIVQKRIRELMAQIHFEKE